MKKVLLSAVAALLILAAGIAAASAETTTLLVYMCVTDLQEDACEDMLEMAEVDDGDAINIVILAGGAKEWELEGLEGNSRTLIVLDNGDAEEWDDWGRKSMGSTESLEQFLQYGFEEYRADRMVVILWDHGAGSEGGICFDETAGDDGLTMVEINEALSRMEKKIPDFHINVFGCDACMMATYEMAAMLSEHPVDYFVASEELEPGTGWDYTALLTALKKNPSMTDEALCNSIIDSYMKAGLRNDPDDYMTLSAVRLTGMQALRDSMEEFADVMSGQIQGGNLASVRRGRSRMYTFGSFDDGSWDMVDLGSALDIYAQFDAEKAAEAKRCLKAVIVGNRQTDNLDPCCGLSILIPQDTTDTFDEYRDGMNLTDVIPNWIGFVNQYVSQLTGGSYHLTSADTSQISMDSFSVSGYTSTSSYFNWMNWDEQSGNYSEMPEEEAEIPITDGTQGFTATLPKDDLAYLDYVEGMLLIDLSDEDMECYVDFGTMQNNLVDWDTGRVVSLYDGTWPVFGGVPVPLYDQSNNGNSRRSLIPVKLNGEYTYLVVVFPAGSTEGRIMGANAGYDQNGLPIRNVTKLKPGDVIIPIYTLYYEEDGKEDLQESEYEAAEIIWEDGMTVTYEDLSDDEEPMTALFCFMFYNIFGEDTMSEMIAFEI